MTRCFITQPIHADALEFLRANGVTPQYASSPDMDAVIAEIGDAQAVITRDLGFSAQALARAPALRVVAYHGAGVNKVAIAEAAARGIFVTRTPEMNSRSVAEMAIGMMLAVARQLIPADRAVRDGQWAFRYAARGIELHGKTLALVGFGAIARHVADIAAQGLGMRVLAYSPSVPDDVFARHGVPRRTDIHAMLREADFVSLHRPSNARDPFVMDAQAFATLRRGAVLVNTSRGAAVDRAALIAALQEGRLAGAALDVLPEEPPALTDPLLHAPNLILAPHLGAATDEALRRMAMMCAQQVLDVLAGREPAHIVRP
ncbi:hydroxyacid dehydrogenase [Acetobacter sp. TBRC 12305]|uniref:Hydroxyacid dehydrogenase n=1 Tax=Acetobacter garciniae TaxID=2817435 RepID=A0A939KRM7_9PROT|nr:hydroxyacid dehydrogenase [Acetobacter garciniae]MBO1325466.1 hydroxyacid dehydrogenase [Acetobacter garciniae]MBX0345362.1 hydroxyacid dehydrogenase [Acetobacter garciniae]